MMLYAPVAPKCSRCSGATGVGRDRRGRIVATCTSCGHSRPVGTEPKTQPEQQQQPYYWAR